MKTILIEKSKYLKASAGDCQHVLFSPSYILGSTELGALSMKEKHDERPYRCLVWEKEMLKCPSSEEHEVPYKME